MRLDRVRRPVILILLLVVPLAAGASPGEDDPMVTPVQAAPRGIHLGFTNDPSTSLTVTWFTDGATAAPSVVEYGADKHLGMQAEGSSAPLPGVEGHVHEVTITGLEPGAPVHYRVGSAQAWSDVFVTRTASAEGPYRILLFADHGTSSDALRTNDRLALEDADLAVIAGDLSYANGDQPEWDLWFDQIQPWASRIPMLTAIGNHEYETGFGTQAYEARMALPGSELYWAIDYGRIHFLALDSYTTGSVPAGHFEAMVAFAEEDLQDAARRRANGEIDHIILVQHHPLYSNHESTNRKVQPDMAALVEQWVHRHGIKVVVVGHNHHYERSFPMVYGIPTTTEQSHYEAPLGWIQHTTGGAGRSLYDFSHPDDFLPWSAVHARRHHYTIMEVDGPTLEFTVLSSDHFPGEVLDRYTLHTAPTSEPPMDPRSTFQLQLVDPDKAL